MPRNIKKKTKSAEIHPDTHFRMLSNLANDPYLTQRALAKKVGVSLGAVNYCLKELIKVGHLKINNFQNSPNKLGYFYIVTPNGIQQKSLLTADFLKRKLKEYQDLKIEIDTIRKDFRGEL